MGDCPWHKTKLCFFSVTLITKRTNEEILCSVCFSRIKTFFYWLKVFCIVVAIGIQNKAFFSSVWLESSFNLPHNNVAFQSLTQHEINKFGKKKQILFMGIHKLLFCSNLKARNKTFFLKITNTKFQTEPWFLWGKKRGPCIIRDKIIGFS